MQQIALVSFKFVWGLLVGGGINNIISVNNDRGVQYLL